MFTYVRTVFIVMTIALIVNVMTGWCYRNSTVERTAKALTDMIEDIIGEKEKQQLQDEEDDDDMIMMEKRAKAKRRE